MSNQLKIYVASHHGMVGYAIIHVLKTKGQTTILTCAHAKFDFTYQAAVCAFVVSAKLDQIYLAPSKVGGVHANNTYE